MNIYSNHSKENHMIRSSQFCAAGEQVDHRSLLVLSGSFSVVGCSHREIGHAAAARGLSDILCH